MQIVPELSVQCPCKVSLTHIPEALRTVLGLTNNNKVYDEFGI